MQACAGGLWDPAQSHPGREVRRAPLALDQVPTQALRGATHLGAVCMRASAWAGAGLHSWGSRAAPSL